MKRILLCLLVGAIAAHGQRFNCGVSKPGTIEVTTASHYVPSLWGFDLATTTEVSADSCTSSDPYFFSVQLPEGNYRVTVVFGGRQSSTTTVRSESRRLMLEKVGVEVNGKVTRTFDVNVRFPEIAGDAARSVKLKPREQGSLDWDHKLTLEFNGDHPSIRSLTITPIKEPTIYLAGDSTVVDQSVEPWAAWGQMLPRFFRPGVAVANHAESGETIRSFIKEERLAKIMSLIQPGDYLFLQFGHNDQKPNAVSLDDYTKLLTETVAKVREKGATPVLVTSVNRRTFDGNGRITNSLGQYPAAVREIAATEHVALIDLNAMSKTLFEAMGVEGSLKAFMHYPANAFPNQGEPISDDTHFNSYGAYELARCVTQGVRDASLPLGKFLAEDLSRFDPAHPDPQATFSLPFTPPLPSDQGDLHQGFLNPPPEARPMMRWWWFGPAVEEPELKKELETMHAVGIGGVEIQPVYPLMLDDDSKQIRNLPYLSHEFLEDVSFANRVARALGMRADITLGSGWPYGGPKTTLDLAAGRLKVLSAPIHSATIALPTLAQGDSLIAAFAVTGTEKAFDPATATRIDLSAPTSKIGQTALFFVASHTGQMVKRPAAGAEGYVLDHFARPAIDEHLTDVAEPLIKAFGSQPPYAVFSDSLEVYGADWTPDLPAEFLKRRGYDLIPHLPELVAGGTPEAEAVRHDWGRTLSELIRDSYLAPITRFAEEHGTRFRSQTYGEPAVTLADEAVPNLPEGEGPQWRAFSFTRLATSASHLYGRNVTSAETWTWLHSPAFRATPLDMKVEADRMFLLGVNQFVGHGYPYSPPAAGEPGWTFYAAAALNAHNPWFAVMPDITRYLQRMSWLLRQGEPANDIAILLPEDDAQAGFTPGHVSVTDEMRKCIAPELMTAILDAGYNVDYIDAATIDKLGKVPYPVLILPPTERIPLKTYRAIESYATSGTVIATGKLPSLAPGLMEQAESVEIAAISSRLFAGGGKGIVLGSVSELGNALHRALPPDIETTGQTKDLGFLHRKLSESDIYFVANTTNQPIEGSIRFRAARNNVEVWDPDSGEILEARKLDAATDSRLALAPYESRVFVFESSPDVTAQAAGKTGSEPTARHEEQLTDLSAGWRIQFSSDEAGQSLPGLVSWTEMPGRQYYSGEADYTRNFTLDGFATSPTHVWLDFGVGTPTTDPRPPNANGIRALLDPPVREAAIVLVNGQRAGSLWHPPYRIDVSRFVHGGENRLEVQVYNTAINLMAGQPPHDYTALRAKYGRRFDPQDMDHLQPVPSGLLGPIRLVAERNQ